MTLGFIPSWQFGLDANTNPALTPFVTYPDGVYQTTMQPIGPYYQTGAPTAPDVATAPAITQSAPDTKLAGLAGLAGPLDISPFWVNVYSALSLAGGVVGAYHGYKRHDRSIGWALGWSVFGSMLAPLALPIMFAQGVGKPIK